VITENDRAAQPPRPLNVDESWLQHELDEAHKTIRALTRQVGKEQTRCDEVLRAYNKTVANLMEIARENTRLEREVEEWRDRAVSAAHAAAIGGHAPGINLTMTLTPDEAGAIRKAMARLHHPDRGGDVERMKAWNAALDALSM
jgi:hypothetical protein